MPTFPEGKFYACNDPETLTHEHPWDALEEYIDADLHPKMTAAEVVACIRARTITVTAYRPMEITDKQIAAWSDALHEKLGEDFSEEHGDPDGGPCDAFPDDSEAVLLAAVTSIIRRSHVWGCEDVGKVTLTPDEIEEVVRKHRPDWFKEPAPQAAPAQGEGPSDAVARFGGDDWNRRLPAAPVVTGHFADTRAPAPRFELRRTEDGLLPAPAACTCVIGPSSVVPSPSCPQHGYTRDPRKRA
jgi:hypothetical protein